MISKEERFETVKKKIAEYGKPQKQSKKKNVDAEIAQLKKELSGL
jgi:hypothetical protein